MYHVHTALRDNMRENTAGKCTWKEISLFRAGSAKVVSSMERRLHNNTIILDYAR